MTRTVRCPVCGAEATQTYVDVANGPRLDRIPGVIICPTAEPHHVGQVVGSHLEQAPPE